MEYPEIPITELPTRGVPSEIRERFDKLITQYQGQAWRDRHDGRPHVGTVWNLTEAVYQLLATAAITRYSDREEFRKQIGPEGEIFRLSIEVACSVHWDIGAGNLPRLNFERFHTRLEALPERLGLEYQWWKLRHETRALTEVEKASEGQTNPEDMSSPLVGGGPRAGMEGSVTEFAQSAAHPPSDSKKVAGTEHTNRVFRKSGRMWTLTFDGKTAYLPEANGLLHIWHLLQCPGQPILAVELRAAAAGGAISLGSNGEVLDTNAILNYRRRLKDVRGALSDAERNNDRGLIELLQGEQDQITAQLRSGLGIGGKKRDANDDVERARKAVSKAIADAVKAIRKSHSPLADHLQRSIDRGRLLSYTGDGTSWSL
jgi:hypothetical protein